MATANPGKSLKKIFKSKAEKEAAEANALLKEGLKAMQLSDTGDTTYKSPTDTYIMDVGDERHTVTPMSLKEIKIQALVKVLLDWVNDVVSVRRIIVRDIVDDFFDGQVLSEFIEILFEIEQPFQSTIAQSVISQRSKLTWSLDEVHKRLNLNPKECPWSVEEIHKKNPLVIIHLLVALARFFNIPQTLPTNVSVQVSVIKMSPDGTFEYSTTREEITGGDTSAVSYGPTKDVFDQLFNERNDRIDVVRKSLTFFVNKKLNIMNIEITNVETEFQSGIYLIYLMCILEGYFIPFGLYHETPLNFDQKLENMYFAFKLIEEAGISLKRTKADEVVHGDVKSVMRVLYSIFTKYGKSST
ncbi:hypothetical protein LOD99_15678 [Oopsacas minuta]|uniref:Calponin-homology (CH) domain-containing protein n=1 Tax=Oopsacas minuta TaxID=111878 RepID=A0AAV7KAA0_9METZ|nr:hypothetical protein LOD99_15678 [Oopsacas minuta]